MTIKAICTSKVQQSARGAAVFSVEAEQGKPAPKQIAFSSNSPSDVDDFVIGEAYSITIETTTTTNGKKVKGR